MESNIKEFKSSKNSTIAIMLKAMGDGLLKQHEETSSRMMICTKKHTRDVSGLSVLNN